MKPWITELMAGLQEEPLRTTQVKLKVLNLMETIQSYFSRQAAQKFPGEQPEPLTSWPRRCTWAGATANEAWPFSTINNSKQEDPPPLLAAPGPLVVYDAYRLIHPRNSAV
ncbi:hypothetical protein D3C76_95730 [compost metagenome]